MGLSGRGLINIITAGGGEGGSTGVTTVEGLSGIIDLDSPDNSINIQTAGQVIELTTPNSGFAPSGASFLLREYNDNGHLTNARILSATSGITLDDFGIRSGSGLVIKLDYDNEPIVGQALTWNGTKLEWATITGGGVDTQTSINGLSGVISLLSANSGAIDIISNGQTLTLSGLFTPASGSIIDQKCADILILSGLINNIVQDAGQTSINGLSGIVLISSPTQALEISTSGQTILLSGIFTPASGAVLQQKCEDINTLSGIIDGLPRTQTSIEGLSGVVDLDSPDGSIIINTNGQVIELTTDIQKVGKTFTKSSGLIFVLEHGLNTTDWTWSMWRTDSTPEEILLPDNIYPSGANHAVVDFTSGDVNPSGYDGRVVFIG